MSSKKNKKYAERVLTMTPFLLYYVYMKRGYREESNERQFDVT